MQRWQLAFLLAAAAVAGAALAPTALQRVGRIGTARHVGTSSALGMDVRLDRRAVLEGTTARRNLVIQVWGAGKAPEAPSVDLALVLDTSCSMGMDGRIGRATMAARMAVDALDAEDRFALVTFGDAARVLVPSGPVGDKQRLFAVVDGLREDGGTNLWDGLAAGREELGGGEAGALRKLVVVSDGAANVGEIEPVAFAGLAGRYAEEGVSVTVVGLGLDSDETLLTGMADAAGGTYRFVGEPEDLPALISRELERAGRTIASGATVRIEAGPGARIVGVRGWPATVANDAAEVHVGDIAAGQTREIVVALDVTADGSEPRDAAKVTLDWTDMAGERGEIRAAAVTYGTPQASTADFEDGLIFSAVTRAEIAELFDAAADAWGAGDDAAARAHIAEVDAACAEGGADRELMGVGATSTRVRLAADREGAAYAAREAREASRAIAR